MYMYLQLVGVDYEGVSGGDDRAEICVLIHPICGISTSHPPTASGRSREGGRDNIKYK